MIFVIYDNVSYKRIIAYIQKKKKFTRNRKMLLWSHLKLQYFKKIAYYQQFPFYCSLGRKILIFLNVSSLGFVLCLVFRGEGTWGGRGWSNTSPPKISESTSARDLIFSPLGIYTLVYTLPHISGSTSSTYFQTVLFSFPNVFIYLIWFHDFDAK